MVWVGRDLKDDLVSTPCHGQGHLPPAQVAPSPIPALGNLCQCLTTLIVENFFLISNLDCPLSLKPLRSSAVTTGLTEKPVPIYKLPLGTGKVLQGLSGAFSLPGLTTTIPSLFS